ncbi:hybrid sensor histidine kinase/response regulator transcription factor [Pedobacter insulae]|uniref:histidine kinase n=1 Tax=Pedobacter insulae TaxID=414048 RepID=A0A1I2Z9B5_9SPHI|nr:two-component regulator propeller domain-containing protein [Pedobacter insulae]SFH34442.1 Two component regulator propeller [Pedobacter insulae]
MTLKGKRGIFLYFLLTLFFVPNLQAIEYPSIVSIGIEKGLSNNSVRCVFKDRKGFMWIGTHDGLNRYDGYEFKVFRNQLGDTTSLPHNYIYTINEDQQHNLWVGTGQGIGIFNNLTSQFSPAYVIHKLTGKREKISGPVNVIETAPNGDVLIGTNGMGLMVRSKNSPTAMQIPINQNGKALVDYNVTAIKIGDRQQIWLFIDPIGLCVYDMKTKKLRLINQTIRAASCIETDKEGNIWLGTTKGLFKYQISTNSISLPYQTTTNGLRAAYVQTLCFDKQQQLWIGTKETGVMILNPKQGKVVHLSTGGVKNYLNSEPVQAIYEDNEGRKWIGTLKGGIKMIASRGASFKTISHDPLNPNGLVNNFASSFLEEADGKLWIGTDGGGISIWDRKRKKFTNLKLQAGNNQSLSNNLVSNIKQDYLGNIWVATFGGGINKFNRSDQTFEHFRCVNQATGLENTDIWQILEDQDKTLWATTFSQGRLYYLNRKLNRFEVFDQNLAMDLIAIREDQYKTLWGGNAHALVKIDKKAKKHIYYEIGKPVRVIYEDKKGNFWIGSEGGGLILFNREEGKIEKRFSTLNGLCNNSILSIVEDNAGSLWISTFSGLSKFNPTRQTFLNFYQDDGLQSNQFLDNAGLKLKSGELVFGGLKGFNIFHPDSIRASKNVPPILITGLRINNQAISSSDPYITKTKGDQIEALEIPFDEAVVAFDFAALDFTAPGKISYAYYMQGWDKGWNYADKLRTAAYTKLSEGTYHLRIKSTNTEGQWMNNEKLITVKVLPPWYRSWWAYSFYAALGLATVYLFIAYQKRQSYLKYQIDLAHLKVKQEQEFSENKLSFFTHISHEFRTPLTLIINPIKEFINSRNSHVDSKDLIIVYRNARRLLSLVDQLLLFRKSEVERLKISKFDLIPFCKEIYVCFSQQARAKNINFNFQCVQKTLNIYADREKIEIVLFNLIANAFKFTPDSGTITLKIEEGAQSIDLHVIDSGPGIAEGTGAKIFERFYQNSNQNSATGFGIGLFLVKKFIESHGGNVSYDSTVGSGTDFKVTLLKGSEHYTGHILHEQQNHARFIPELIEEDIYIDALTEITQAEDKPQIAPDLDATTEKKAILIVEDNEEIRNYVKQIFKTDYLIYEAEDGSQGYETAKKHVPDIIITDVIMKEVSGVDLCMKVKSNPELSHIPVILLTSSSSSEIKLKGIEQGADDFITKPFDKDILLARVANLLKSRNTLQKYFFNEITLKSEDFKVSNEYKEFLEKCIAITEQHLDDADFNVKTLAEELATSPSLLYRKVKSISGKSTNEFIRYIRLRKAAQLMVSSDYNVNQTALLCGFNDVRYFREQFSKLFGIRPSDYIKKYRGNLANKHRVIRQ